jgi:excisionase family DNA binding protein
MTESYEKDYWTQQELADRYGVSESTIKNWRDEGHLPFLRFPGSTHILYPVDAIKAVETKHTTPTKEADSKKRTAVMKRKKPVVSTTPEKEWRI